MSPSKSSITESEKDFVVSFFDDLRVLLNVLGYQIFEDIKKEGVKTVYYCKSKAADAQGEYTEEGFVVFKGSKANKESAPSFKKTNWPAIKDKLKQKEILADSGDTFHFTEDFLFSSRSPQQVNPLDYLVSLRLSAPPIIQLLAKDCIAYFMYNKALFYIK